MDWMGRLCDDPVIKSPEGDYAQYIFAGNGINVQTSYLFKSNWEIALRNSILLPKDKVKPYTKYYSNNQATVGVTRYIIGHNLKVQADASYNYRNGMSSSKYNRYEIRFQVELGF